MQEFLQFLKEHDIDLVVDVRRFPGSRSYPHINKGNLELSLI